MAAASSLQAAAPAATPCAGLRSDPAARSARVAAARARRCGRRLAKADAPSSAAASSPMGDIHEVLMFEALREALIEEMKLDPKVCVFGEDVGHYGGSYKVTKGLAEMFGDLRVLDTPIAENSFTGMGIGAAVQGLKPVR
ncbi:hypothetical protein ACP4OV_007654 [Aristida adscensionis]